MFICALLFAICASSSKGVLVHIYKDDLTAQHIELFRYLPELCCCFGTAAVRINIKMHHASSSKAPFEGALRKLEPEWLESLLNQASYGRCSEPYCPLDDLDEYCIDCDVAFCVFCVKIPSHENHRCLKLYRHRCMNVVPIKDIEQHIEYSQIQQYEHNGQMVLALSPLRQPGSKRRDNEAKCRTCHILDSYCSISCKAKAFTRKANSDSHPFPSLDILEPNGRQKTEGEKPVVDHSAKKGASRKLEPEWLGSLLNQTSYGRCSEPYCLFDDLEKYCIDCDVSFCGHCVKIPFHENHRCLNIYRHLGKNVVPVKDIESHIEYSQIQQYEHNGQMVLALSPLPQPGLKRSGNEAKCRTCNRVLIRNPILNSYCSISCKAKAFTQKADSDSLPLPLLDILEPNGRQESEGEKPAADHPAKKVKLGCDYTSADQAGEKEAIAKMIVEDEVPKELDLNKNDVGHPAEMAQQEAELELQMLVNGEWVPVTDEAPNLTKKPGTKKIVTRRRLSF